MLVLWYSIITERQRKKEVKTMRRMYNVWLMDGDDMVRVVAQYETEEEANNYCITNNTEDGVWYDYTYTYTN